MAIKPVRRAERSDQTIRPKLRALEGTQAASKQEDTMSALRERAFLIAILLLGLLLRLDFLFASDLVIEADEAIVGLMAKHISEGAPWPTFYYGQHYMGSFEPLMVAVIFLFTGVSTLALKSVPLCFALLFIFLVYRIGRVLGGQQTALLGALLAALAPSALVVWSVKARGGFIELVCIGAVALLLTVKNCGDSARSLASFFLIGVVLGFGWWVNNQIIYFVLPIGLVLAVQREAVASRLHFLQRKLLWFLTGLAGFFLGGAPFWLYNLQNKFVSFQMFGGASPNDTWGQFGTFFTGALPILLGARGFWQERDLFWGSSLMMWVVYTPLLCVLGVLVARDFREMVFERKATALLLLVLFFGATTVVFCMSSFGYLYKAPRYLLPLYVAIFPLTAFAAVALLKHVPVVSYLCVAGIVMLQILSCYPGRRLLPGEPFVFKGQRVSHDHSELIGWLQKQSISWVRTNYWIGYRLAFETREKVRFLLFQNPYQERIPAYTKAAADVPMKEIPYVLVPGQSTIVKRALDVLGMKYSSAELSGYIVLYDISPSTSQAGSTRLYDVQPSQLPAPPLPSDWIRAAASDGVLPANSAIDGDRLTRWGSGRPQNPTMSFSLSFLKPVSVKGLKFDLGQWTHDYPRGLRIEIELPDGQRKTLLRPREYRAIRYLYEDEPVWMMYLEGDRLSAIHFYQTESDPVFDWSIAEVTVFGHGTEMQ